MKLAIEIKPNPDAKLWTASVDTIDGSAIHPLKGLSYSSDTLEGAERYLVSRITKYMEYRKAIRKGTVRKEIEIDGEMADLRSY